MAGRTSDEEARRTRRRIVAHAADVASEQGLDALSLGKLATELSMSKAGVVGQFGSKQGLQLAVLDHAVHVFVEVVWTPAEDAAPGLTRLESVCESWTRYIADPPLRGGCFLSAAAFEWDSRPGPISDALRTALRGWTRVLEREIRTAVDAGELPADAEPAQVAFTLEALAAAATPATHLYGKDVAAQLCRGAMRATLGLAS